MAIDFLNSFDPSSLCTRIAHPLLKEKGIQLSMLRLDLVHPQIAGNKWFKLKYNLVEAKLQNAQSLLSFGGAYSNHLHALAFAGHLLGWKTIGIVRGERVENETLLDCRLWGMELHFISRTDYKERNSEAFLTDLRHRFKKTYIIPEGGNNRLGLKGCKEILALIPHENYQWICCPVGTGATFTGLIESAGEHQQLLGFASIKNGHYLNQEIERNTVKRNWIINHDYHFGGFAKSTNELQRFIQQFQSQQAMELDKVYTAKMIFGLFDLIRQDYFKQHDHLLAIHTGGLQGNRSINS